MCVYITATRSYYQLHSLQCKQRVRKCDVKGCSKLVRIRDVGQHMKESYESHAALQTAELQHLKQALKKVKICYNPILLLAKRFKKATSIAEMKSMNQT